MAGGSAGAQHVVAEVDGVDLVYVFGRDGQDAAAETAVARVAHHKVETTQILVRLIDDLLGHFGLFEARLIDEALATQLFDFLLGLDRAFLAGVIGDGHVVAVFGQHDGNALSNVVASAGDECSLVHKIHPPNKGLCIYSAKNEDSNRNR